VTVRNFSMRVVYAQKHHHNHETSCVPTKAPVIAFALLPTDAIKWSSTILNSPFEVTC